MCTKCRLKKKMLIALFATVLVVGIFAYVVYKDVKPIGGEITDMDKVLISYMDATFELNELGVAEPVTYSGIFELKDYPEKQNKIKNILDKYYYYKKIAIKTPSVMEGDFGMIVTIMSGGKIEDCVSITLYEDKNQISIEHYTKEGGTGDYMYYMKGKDSLTAMIEELIAVLEEE